MTAALLAMKSPVRFSMAVTVDVSFVPMAYVGGAERLNNQRGAPAVAFLTALQNFGCMVLAAMPVLGVITLGMPVLGVITSRRTPNSSALFVLML